MRSLRYKLKFFMLASALALGGCLVSEEPVLDAANGRATPLGSGSYVMCPVGEDADDCQLMDVSFDASRLYTFTSEDEDPIEMRFRRVGRHGYAVQTLEDDGYIYYYGNGDRDQFQLTMMLCADLPETLRKDLVGAGHLEADDDDFDTCLVKTRRGLTASARAYHRGEIESEDDFTFEFNRVTDVQ